MQNKQISPLPPVSVQEKRFVSLDRQSIPLRKQQQVPPFKQARLPSVIAAPPKLQQVWFRAGVGKGCGGQEEEEKKGRETV